MFCKRYFPDDVEKTSATIRRIKIDACPLSYERYFPDSDQFSHDFHVIEY